MPNWTGRVNSWVQSQSQERNQGWNGEYGNYQHTDLIENHGVREAKKKKEEVQN